MFKKGFRKAAALLAAAAMTAGALCACGNVEQTGSSAASTSAESAAESTAEKSTSGSTASGEAESAKDTDSSTYYDADGKATYVDWWDEEAPEVNWYIWNVGGTVSADGVKAVQDAVNEITLKKINVKVNLQVLEMGNYMAQMAMQVSAGDKIDLMTTFPAGSASYTTMANGGQLTDLNTLLDDYAPEIKTTVGEKVLSATTMGDKLYAVPAYTDMTNDLYWECREAYLTEAGFKAEDIKSLDDITKVYEKVHELHPDMKMLTTAGKGLIGSSGSLINGTRYDYLGTKLAAVMTDTDSSKVVGIFETDEMKNTISTLNSWYQAGYIDKDAAINDVDPTSDKTVFSFVLGGNQARTHGNDGTAGEKLARVKLADGLITTSSVAIMDMAIPVSATEPEAAAALMNLCYTDKELKTLVSYGIEGTDYTVASDGGIVPVDGDTVYCPNALGIFGNAFLCAPTEEDMQNGYDMSKIDQSSLQYSPLLGFSIDTSNISTEAAQLSSVFEEYGPQIECGMADDATYQEFLTKLKDSGMDTYLSEIQKQLDDWLASKK